MDAQRVTVTPDVKAEPASTTSPAVEITGEGTVRVLVDNEGKPLTDAPKDERPSWLPEGFTDGEALAKSYQELRTKMSQGKPPEALGDPAPKPVTPSENKASDFAAILSEVAKDGQVSEKSYTDLAAKGIDKTTIDTYVAGQRALAKESRASLAEVAGGDEQLTTVLTWARSALSPADKEVYDTALQSGSMPLLKMALANVVAQYNVANPNEGKRVTAGIVPSSAGVAPFKSNAEMIEAMSNPKYKKDQAYRDEIAKRVAVS